MCVCVCIWHLNWVSSFFILSQLSAGGATLAFHLQGAANSCVWCDVCHTHVALPNDDLVRVWRQQQHLLAISKQCSAFLLCIPGFGASACSTLPPQAQLSMKKGCLHWELAPNAPLSCLVCFNLKSPFPHTGTAASAANSSWCSQGALNALKCFSAGDCEHLLCHNPSCVWRGWELASHLSWTALARKSFWKIKGWFFFFVPNLFLAKLSLASKF